MLDIVTLWFNCCLGYFFTMTDTAIRLVYILSKHGVITFQTRAWERVHVRINARWGSCVAMISCACRPHALPLPHVHGGCLRV